MCRCYRFPLVKRWTHILVLWLWTAVVWAGPEDLSVGGDLDPSLLKDVWHAMRIATDWLEKYQQDDGCWSNPDFPALTALAVSAIMHSPDVTPEPYDQLPESVRRGLDFILGHEGEDVIGCVVRLACRVFVDIVRNLIRVQSGDLLGIRIMRGDLLRVLHSIERCLLG